MGFSREMRHPPSTRSEVRREMANELVSRRNIAAPMLLVKGRQLVVDRMLVMGVVNASPESFSDAGRFSSLAQQVELCASLVEAGADIIDVGGQSAITNQVAVNPEQEVERVLPIVEWLSMNHPDVMVSVDTYKPRVVDADRKSTRLNSSHRCIS